MKDGQQYGPYTSEQIQLFLQQGNFQGGDLLWYEGLAEWKRIDSVFTVQQQPAPVVPTYPPVRSRPVRRGQHVKSHEKSGSIVVKLGIGVLALAVLWIGTTLVFSLLTKERFVATATEWKSIRLEKYEPGLFSSRAVTKLSLADNQGTRREDSLRFNHKIWHGPMAFPGGKPKFVLGYATTEMVRPKENESGEDFAVSVHSEIGMGGNSVNTIDFKPLNATFKDGGSVSFEGGQIKLFTSPDLAVVKGSIDISPLVVQADDMNLMLDAIKGTADFRNSQSLDIAADLGGIKLEIAIGGQNEIFRIEPPKLSVSYRKHSPDLPLLVGHSALKFPLIKSEGSVSGQLRNAEFKTVNALDSKNQMRSSTKFEIGKILVGDAAQPLFDLDETFLEFGYNGLDAKSMADLNIENEKIYMQQAKMIASGLDASQLEDSGEVQEATNELVRLWLDLIRPGAGLFVKLQLGGPETKINLNASLGGEKKITETVNLREVVAALQTDLNVTAGGKIMENPLVAIQVQGLTEGGIGEMRGDTFFLTGKVREGTVFLNEMPMPFLEMLGPILDEPIDWEEILEVRNGNEQ